MAILYRPYQGKPTRTPFVHDPDEQLDYYMRYSAPAWAPANFYSLGSLVTPSRDLGLYFECTAPGVSGVTEPAWNSRAASTVKDGEVTWTVGSASPLLQFGEVITESSWAADNGVQLGSSGGQIDTFDDYSTKCWVIGVPTAVTSFTLTNSIVTNLLRRYDHSIVVKVASK